MLIRLLAALLVIPSFAYSETESPYLVLSDLVYAEPEGLPQLLDLYLPKKKSSEPFPVVVWVHGGGWKNGSKKNPKAEYLAEYGFAVASINMRLTHEAIWPGPLEDCREAVRWLRRNAAGYGLDAENIGAWGSSSGGHGDASHG